MQKFQNKMKEQNLIIQKRKTNKEEKQKNLKFFL